MNMLVGKPCLRYSLRISLSLASLLEDTGIFSFAPVNPESSSVPLYFQLTPQFGMNFTLLPGAIKGDDYLFNPTCWLLDSRFAGSLPC